MKPFLFLFLLFVILATGCGPAEPATFVPSEESVTETRINTDLPTDTVMVSPTSPPDDTDIPTPGPEDWKTLPIVPEGVSDAMKEVYRRGLDAGHYADRFSKFGDCQNVPSLFLGTFDEGTYELGEEYAYLQETIDTFKGSWNRDSAAVIKGANVASIQTLYWIDPEKCKTTESPMVCEIRVNEPSIVIISLETWWADKPTSGYDDRMRSIVDYVLSQDVVPILATKADNMEGDNSINAAIARIAFDYQLPLWNFWAATYPLPYHGLSDGFHLTFAQNIFNDPFRMQSAWPWRNLTALQTIDAVYRSLNELP